MNYGTSGIGSTHHHRRIVLAASHGSTWPFRSSWGRATPALVGGQVQMIFRRCLPSPGSSGQPRQAAGAKLEQTLLARPAHPHPLPRGPSPVLTSRPPLSMAPSGTPPPAVLKQLSMTSPPPFRARRGRYAAELRRGSDSAAAATSWPRFWRKSRPLRQIIQTTSIFAD